MMTEMLLRANVAAASFPGGLLGYYLWQLALRCYVNRGWAGSLARMTMLGHDDIMLRGDFDSNVSLCLRISIDFVCLVLLRQAAARIIVALCVVVLSTRCYSLISSIGLKLASGLLRTSSRGLRSTVR